MKSRYDSKWHPWIPAHEHGDEGAGGAAGGDRNVPPPAGAAPPAAYFISVLELATGETLGNDERLRAVAMLESHFGAGRPRTLTEAVRICAAAIDSSTLQRMARGAKA
ncbi:hypothetical protein BPUN_2777 [Candidatus Paraburkholderia kirkii]|nr:hypothetical protein BPUN_2777 [Candidatus Paraburkholderia kirkii]